MSDNFTNFINDMTKVVECCEKDGDRVLEAERLVDQLIRTTDWLPEEKQAPDDGQYARHSLYRDPLDRFEVLALVWKPGQKTPLHDHDGTWGVEGVVKGRMRITNYLQLGTLPDNIVKLSYSGAVNVNEQSTGQLLPPADCHILEAIGEENVVTIHVYGKQLKSFKVFELVDEAQDLYKAHDHAVGYTIESND
ncbi:cysteine dioxygenase [Camelliibacillus cellulosilyticus]|uniref:Cysteine dioxygenase n=1 Tax=Camelliibacillus cellulosilyticus TaxID=2174486 RepID=A0ABV9GKD5_9BACL